MNEFWFVVRKEKPELKVISKMNYPGINLPLACIVEWTPDEQVFVWPVHPNFDILCMVCKNLFEKSYEVCNTGVPNGYPCRFEAVPEAETHQDFDDFLIDGEFIAEYGYFYSFSDFMRYNQLSADDFMFYKLGAFPSIRGARNALPEAAQIYS